MSSNMDEIPFIIYYCSDNPLGNYCIMNLDGTEKNALPIDGDRAGFYSIYGLSINTTGQVAFTCEDMRRNRNVCITNLQGSVLKQLTDSSLPSGISRHPHINNLGHIVFECEGVASNAVSNICLMNGEGGSKEVLTAGKPSEFVRSPRINNSNQVVYECRSAGLENICATDISGSGFKELISEDRQIFDISQVDLNASGQIVYTCSQQSGPSNICVTSIDGSDFEVLTDSYGSGQDGSPWYYSPTINDHGEIAFVCSYELFDSRICFMNFDGSNLRVLTSRIGYGNDEDPQITNTGQIVYECKISESHGNICIMNTDGSGHKTLTNLSFLGAHLGVGFYWSPHVVE